LTTFKAKSSHLGIDTEAQCPSGSGRPVAVLPSGKAVEELM
jgi:hypothetical protein